MTSEPHPGTAPASAPAAAPVAASERIAALDVLRGFALFGVFMVNLNYVSGPQMGVVGPESSGIEHVAQAILKGLFESKFVTLFSLLFGMGLVLQMQRAEAKGVAMGKTYLRRLGILFCMGILHGIFLFEGDILFLYSLAGLVLFACHRWRPRKLALVSLAPFGIGVALTCLWALAGDSLGDGFGDEGDFAERQARAATEGPLLLTIQVRAMTFAFIQIFFSVISFNWRVLALFFLGASLMKSGFLRAENRAVHARLAVVGISLGLVLEGLAAYVHWIDTDAKLTSLVGALGHEFGSLILAFGFAGAVLRTVHGGLAPRLAGWLACVGRMALTNYLTQSVLMNVVLYWYGFALWNKLTQWQYIGIVCALFACQIAFSVWWMKRFAIGPMEWAWRALTYGRRPAWR